MTDIKCVQLTSKFWDWCQNWGINIKSVGLTWVMTSNMCYQLQNCKKCDPNMKSVGLYGVIILDINPIYG